MALNKTKRRIELQIGLEVLRERQLNLHSAGSAIVKNNLFTIELLIDYDVQVILFFLDIDWYVDAGALDRDRNRLRVVLILHEQREILEHVREFHRNECKLDLRAAVTVNLSSAFKADLCKEIIEVVGLAGHALFIALTVTRVRNETVTGHQRCVAPRGFHEFTIDLAGDLARGALSDLFGLFGSFRCASGVTFSAFLALSLVHGCWSLGPRRMLLIHFSTLLLLLDVFDGDKSNSGTIRGLHIHLSGQRSFICNLQVLSVLLSKDNFAEVYFWLFDLNQGFFARANERDVDAARFTQYREMRDDVLVKLRRESNRDSRGEACGHSTRRRVLDHEEILDFVFKGQ